MGLAHGDTLRQVGVSVSRATVSRRACNRPVALHHNLVLVTPQPVFTQGHDCGAKRPREATPSPAREGARLAHSKSRARQRPAGPGVASAGRPRRTRAGGPSGSGRYQSAGARLETRLQRETRPARDGQGVTLVAASVTQRGHLRRQKEGPPPPAATGWRTPRAQRPRARLRGGGWAVGEGEG